MKPMIDMYIKVRRIDFEEQIHKDTLVKLMVHMYVNVHIID